MLRTVQIPGILRSHAGNPPEFHNAAVLVRRRLKTGLPAVMIHGAHDQAGISLLRMNYGEFIGHPGIFHRIVHELRPFVVVKGR